MNTSVIAGIIILISFAVRFWSLASYPPSLSMDEVGFGYNAYSILKTGKDEFGTKFPLAFRALGDYKPPVDVYITVPSILTFGFNEFAIRFPVAFLGALTVLVWMLLLKEIKFSNLSTLAGGLWFALLPSHVFFSRASFEAVTALFFLLGGVLLFLTWIRKNLKWQLTASFISFGISMWSYNAQRLFVPTILLFLVFWFRKKVLLSGYSIIFAGAILAVFVFPLIFLSLQGNYITARAQELSFIHDPLVNQQLHNGIYSSVGEWVFNNDAYVFIRYWLGQYLNYFDARFIFWNGLGIVPQGYPGVGLLYATDSVLLVLGIYALIKTKKIFLRSLLLFWFLLGILPASLTRGDPSAIRVLLWLPAFGMLMVLGVEWFVAHYQNKSLFAPGVFLYAVLTVFSVSYALDMYRNNFHKFYADIWHYGYKEVAQYACQNWDKYDQIIITDKYGAYWPSVKAVPYLYILTFCQYDPAKYLQNRQLYNIAIRQPQWRLDSRFPNTLLIGSRWDFPEGFPQEKIMKKIFFLNGEPAFYFVPTGAKI